MNPPDRRGVPVTAIEDTPAFGFIVGVPLGLVMLGLLALSLSAFGRSLL